MSVLCVLCQESLKRDSVFLCCPVSNCPSDHTEYVLIPSCHQAACVFSCVYICFYVTCYIT